MGVCDLCGQKAQWLKSRHPACTQRTEYAKSLLHDLALNGTLSGKTFSELEAEARALATERRVPFDQVQDVILSAAQEAAGKIALQSPVSQDEYRRVAGILEGFGIDRYVSNGEFVRRRWFGRAQLDMSLIIWQVLHGLNPVYDGTDRMQFNLQSEEVPIFTAGTVAYAEERTTNVRTFNGLSVPVGAGIYYHVGGSHTQHASGLVPLDVGEVLITTHSIYFGGQSRTLKIRMDHVIRYQQYLDGVGVCESHGHPKVLVMNYSGLETGWFFFNLLSALTNRLTQRQTV